MDNMLSVYLFEANELLERLEEILLACEKQGSFDVDSINEIFRIMHTVKGSSAMMQFNSLATVAHKVEDLFFFVRDNNGVEDQYTSELFDIMFKANDFIKAEVEKVENNQPLSEDNDAFVSEILGFLAKISGDPSKAAGAKPAAAPAPAAAPKAEEPAKKAEESADAQNGLGFNEEELAEEQIAICKTKKGEGFNHLVKVYFDEEAQMENLRAFMLVNAITDVCGDTGIDYYPKDIQQAVPEVVESIVQHGFLVFFKEADDLDKSIKIIESFVYTKNYEILDKAEEPKEEKAEDTSKASDSEQNKAAAQKAPAKQNAKPAAPVKQNLINVNLAKLDSLMDLVGEIVITEAMVSSSAVTQNGDMGTDSNFAKHSRELRKLVNELQEIVMSIRLVPVSGTFQKMNRIVRDMSKKLDKDVQLELIGENTEIDKTILDTIADPIMHAVRNAMDHGIETKEDRAKTDKDPVGKVTLSAQNTGGEIVICVEDDGKGVDPDVILAKAKEKGLLTKPESEYTQKEIIAFLMSPGFSTKKAVTEFSGRGVGMDVVKKNIEKIGGTVIWTSELGKGSKIEFKIPLTLAIVNGMKASVGDTVFTIPVNNIKESFKATKGSILHDTDGNEIIMVRQEYYPVVRLYDVFGIETDVKEIQDGLVILVETREISYCLFVDQLLGEQQVVVKPLPNYVNKYDVKKSGIAGCAILGDGSISIILDIPDLYANN